jgi:glycosyltransferase involved in cell wall biosynthesis
MNIIGVEKGNTGINVHTRNFYNSLKKIRNVTFTDIQDSGSVGLATGLSGPHIIINLLVDKKFLDMFTGTKILFIAFESDRVPDNIIECCNNFDYIWVPSTWQKLVFAERIPANKIRVIPEGCDPGLYNPFGNGDLLNFNAFKFLAVGKYETRKSYQELFAAFKAEFGNNPAVRLILKADNFANPSANKQLEKDLQELGITNISVVKGNIDESKMAELYRSCDAFVFPSKAEGWGLPLIEAICCGIPVITTYYSGHTEFLKPIRGLFLEVDYKLVDIDADDFKMWGYRYSDGNYGRWAKPDVDSLRSKMRDCYEKRGYWKGKAMKAAEMTMKGFNWDQSAIRAAFELA